MTEFNHLSSIFASLKAYQIMDIVRATRTNDGPETITGRIHLAAVVAAAQKLNPAQYVDLMAE